MHSFSRAMLAGLGLLALALPATAGGWQSFAAAFPTNACQDGWTACITSGGAVGPGMLHDTAGRPLPSDGRLGWFDLQPTASFSPFVGLSSYSGAAGGEVPRPAPVAAVQPTPVAASNPTQPTQPSNVQASNNPDASIRTLPAATPNVAVSPTANPNATMPPNGNATPNSTLATRPTQPSSQPSSQPSATPVSMQPTSQPATQPVTQPVANIQPVATPVATPVSQPAPTPTANIATSQVSNDCTDLVTLEPAAMMGSLTLGQTKCLEARLSSESQQTTKAKISLVLINNAEGKGDKTDWERLVKRHLEEIDRSDPDLCYKYSLQLSRGGAGRASGVIRWADYSLENKSKWTGNTYKSRVFALERLKTEAANKLWQDAEATYTTEHTDENEAKSAKYRGMTKDYAREWLDYAKASAQDTKSAMQYCVSAAGTTAFCEG